METLVESTLKGLLEALGVDYKGIARNEIAGQVIFAIEADDGRQLIGPHGDVIHAIDHIVRKIVEKKLEGTREAAVEGAEPSEHTPLPMIDVNDYRSKQIRDLQTKAKMMAERARSFQYDVELSPMTAYERLIVHTTLQGAPNVKTESQGEGRSRRVVIKYSPDA